MSFVATSINPSVLNGFVGKVSVDKIPVATETLTLTEDVKPSTTMVTDNKKPISLLDSSIGSKNDVDESFAARHNHCKHPRHPCWARSRRSTTG